MMQIAEAVRQMAGQELPIEVVAYDGSRAGSPEAGVRVEVRSPLALSHIASAPGQLGLVRAYVTGALEIVGDMYTALASLPDVSIGQIPREVRMKIAAKLAAARLWWPTRPPAEESRL